MTKTNINKPGLLPRKNGKHVGIHSLMMLLATLLGPLAAAQATDWGFTLIGAPTAENEQAEILRMTGAGAFNPAKGTAAGGGSFAFFNAFDENPVTGILRGTWTVTGFDSFDSQGGPNRGAQGGTLLVEITLLFEGGPLAGASLPGTLAVICPFVNGAFQESGDAIVFTTPVMPEAQFTIPTGGLTAFHIQKP